MVKLHHPDASDNESEKKIKKINAAYTVLSSSELRLKYDSARYQLLSDMFYVRESLNSQA